MNKERQCFEDIFSFGDYIDNLWEFADYNINVVADYEIIIELINVLLKEYDFYFASGEVFYGNNYTLYIDTDNCELHVVPFEECEFSDDEIIFVHGDVPSMRFSNINSAYEFELCEYCQENEITTEDDDNYITQSWTSDDGKTYYSRSVMSSDKDVLDAIRKEWNIK